MSRRSEQDGTPTMKVDEADTAEAPVSCQLRPRASAVGAEPPDDVPLDIRAVRARFAFPRSGRIVTNNAASTQAPRELLELYRSLAPGYENVHRGSPAHPRR